MATNKTELDKHSRVVLVKDLIAVARNAKFIRDDYRTHPEAKLFAERIIEVLARYTYRV